MRDYGVHLVQSGRKFKALCPFHQEKTPSFWIDPDKQLYYCYGCQAGGDLFRFVMEVERVEFPEAVEMLARRAGVVIEYTAADRARSDRRQVLFDVLEGATAYYHRVLMEDSRGEIAREYLRGRGIREDMWKHFRLGYSLPEWDGLLRQLQREASRAGGAQDEVEAARRAALEAAERVGLARRSDAGGRAGGRIYDYFRGRLMFPIDDAQGRTIGFGARTLGDDEPKYLNTPATPLFDKSQVLYGLSRAKAGIRRDGRLAVVEGYTDAIVAHQEGLDWFVASLGTAFTADNARSLRRLAPRISMLFDGDAAGQGASERSLDLLVGEELEVDVYSVTAGKDPCDAIQALGADAFRQSMESEAVGIFEFKWRRTVGAAEAAGASPQARAQAVDEFLRLVKGVPNDVARRYVLRDYLERLERYGVREKDIDQRLAQLRNDRPPPSAPERASDSGPPAPADASEEREMTAADRELVVAVLRCLVGQPEQAAEVWAAVPKALFAGRTGRALSDSMDAQLAAGGFSGVQLAHDVADSDANRIVIPLLDEAGDSDDDSGSRDIEWEAMWRICRRDLRRWETRQLPADEIRRQRRQKLEEAARAEAAGDKEQARALRLESHLLLKESKRR